MIQFKTTPVSDTPAPTPSELLESCPVRRMATAMIELEASGHTVDAEALQLHGFTQEEIADHAAAARDLANTRIVRRIDGSAMRAGNRV